MHVLALRAAAAASAAEGRVATGMMVLLHLLLVEQQADKRAGTLVGVCMGTNAALCSCYSVMQTASWPRATLCGRQQQGGHGGVEQQQTRSEATRSTIKLVAAGAWSIDRVSRCPSHLRWSMTQGCGTIPLKSSQHCLLLSHRTYKRVQ